MPPLVSPVYLYFRINRKARKPEINEKKVVWPVSQRQHRKTLKSDVKKIVAWPVSQRHSAARPVSLR